MRYYAVSFPNYVTIIVKTTFGYKNFLNKLLEHRAVMAPSGSIYNLKQFESFRELNNPGTTQKHCAITFDELI